MNFLEIMYPQKTACSVRGLKCITGYVIFNNKLSRKISDTRVFRGELIASDHVTLISAIDTYNIWEKNNKSVKKQQTEQVKYTSIERRYTDSQATVSGQLTKNGS